MMSILIEYIIPLAIITLFTVWFVRTLAKGINVAVDNHLDIVMDKSTEKNKRKVKKSIKKY